ncbi:chaplin [Streptomyces sp. B1I3]|uniref:chaplin n=1 Tax=Streptomyces sp. B1I3 TaxID=3042264 RepID=UPI00278B0A09|nr:chaplin [Streptomyces sp. B1I3]MDQ0793162.1 LPXTG-motif cell wall-anchored protein [Streptomyces sp. B1I3]
MRQVLNKSMIVMAAASGILSAAGGYAHADASADGLAAGSPGVGSGNAVQVPVHIPVNLCGNTVDVIALLNPAFGNRCANVDSGKDHDDDGSGASAEGAATGSPGVLSGNLVQVPVDVPVNVCGNSVNVVGALNPTAGNNCVNDSGHQHEHPPVDEPPVDEPPVDEPPTSEPPVDEPPTSKPPVDEPPASEPPAGKPPVDQPPAGNPGPNSPGTQLAQTGAGDIGLAAGASAALLLGGAVLMRRTRRN